MSPDASSTRFSLYLHAAAELKSRPDFYVGLLEQLEVCYSKEKPGLNHLEDNVQRALLDAPALTELAVLTSYLEAVSHQYVIIIVRGRLGLEKSRYQWDRSTWRSLTASAS